MSPEAQRIAIAEACGWTGVKSGWEGQQCFGYEHPEHGYVTRVPDYLNDLNAMHEAEKIIDNDKRLSDALMNTIRDSPDWVQGAVEARYRTCRATASQHAEAFLRTIGKWKEEE